MLVDNINENTNQNIEFLLSDNSVIYLDLHFKDNLQQWTLDLKYEDVEIYGILLTCSDNILYQYSNILPFGIEITGTDDMAPFLKNCFTTGRNQIIINEF